MNASEMQMDMQTVNIVVGHKQENADCKLVHKVAKDDWCERRRNADEGMYELMLPDDVIVLNCLFCCSELMRLYGNCVGERFHDNNTPFKYYRDVEFGENALRLGRLRDLFFDLYCKFTRADKRDEFCKSCMNSCSCLEMKDGSKHCFSQVIKTGANSGLKWLHSE